MKAEEVRGLADDELKQRISELEEERFRLRFRAGTEALEEPLRLRSVRRDIARLQTIARERALGIVRTTEAKAPVAKKGAAKKGTARKATAKKAAAKKATKASGR
jgi:large subunit ribosomal protein L29